MYEIDTHAGVSIAGLLSDGRILARYLQTECSSWRWDYKQAVPIKKLAESMQLSKRILEAIFSRHCSYFRTSSQYTILWPSSIRSWNSDCRIWRKNIINIIVLLNIFLFRKMEHTSFKLTHLLKSSACMELQSEQDLSLRALTSREMLITSRNVFISEYNW